MLRREFEKKER